MITIKQSNQLAGGPMEHTPVYKGSPDAPVRLVDRKTYWNWEVVRCPFCEGTHEHGGIPKSEDPYKYLGGRMAHCSPESFVPYEVAVATPCWNGDAEYRLIAIEGKPSKAELDEHFPTVRGTELNCLHISNWTEGVEYDDRYQKYMASNPDKGSRAPFTAEIKDHVWMETGGHCSYCGVVLRPFSSFSIDHITPVSRGGTNDLFNLVACCKSCNSIKGDRDVEYLRSRLGITSFWFEREGGAS